jgi:ribonuclease III
MTNEELQQLEALLGYKFQQPERLDQALTHRSLQDGCDNDRLEFLGDRVLGLVASATLFQLYPDWNAGKLSKGLARLVSENSLHAAARQLNLGVHLRLGPGEEKTGGREKKRLLSDAYEAVLGAIYLDGGLERAGDFLHRSLLEPAMLGEIEGLERLDHKSALQEWLQERGLDVAEYRLKSTSGPDHRKTFEVEVWHGGKQLSSSEGSTKKAAEQAAAERALHILAGN